MNKRCHYSGATHPMSRPAYDISYSVKPWVEPNIGVDNLRQCRHGATRTNKVFDKPRQLYNESHGLHLRIPRDSYPGLVQKEEIRGIVDETDGRSI